MHKSQTPSGRRGSSVAEQGYLAPLDNGAGSFCRSLYALVLMFPPKLSSHTHTPTSIVRVALSTGYNRAEGNGP
jgi:hypothetical protein